MDCEQTRSVIKYLHLKGLNQKQIIDELQKTLAETAPSNATVYRWVAEFKRGRESTKDEHRSGRPKTVSTPEIIDKIKKIVQSDKRMTIKNIAYDSKISEERIFFILTHELQMKKLSARWVPRSLTKENMKNRMNMSMKLLNRFELDPDNFMQRLITQDETWVHYYTPEPKIKSMQWCNKGSPPPKKFKTVLSAGKVMASVFWDSEGILMIDYLQSGQTISGEYYANELRQLREVIKAKRHGKLKKGVLLLQDNAPVHTACVATTAAAKLGFELLPHPPYSPDLAPSDFFLFPKLKAEISGRRFKSNDEVIDAVEGFFESQDKQFFSDGLGLLQKRWIKCISIQGDYVEKKKK